ncbi:MAG: type II secretion system F family protein [Firmicutes bacterium]|nr:type II secretion system F family protein [Bacillota bacterium]
MNRNIELANYTNELAFLLKKGISPGEAIKNTYVNLNDAYLKESFSKVAIALGYGAPLSRALSESPRIYPPQALKIIACAEACEDIPQTLTELADSLKNEARMKVDVRTILRFPIMPMNIILCLALFISQLMSPMYFSLFKSMNLNLPITTKFILFMNSFFQNPVFFMLYISFIVVINVLFFIKDVSKNQILYSLPITGKLIKKFYAYRTAMWSSLMLEKGVKLQDALSSIAEGTDFEPVKTSLNKLAAEISSGKSFSGVASSMPLFPAIFKWFNEQYSGKGDLKNCLESCAKIMRTDIMDSWNTEGKNTASTFMLLLLGIAGVMILSVFLPMYQLIGSIG